MNFDMIVMSIRPSQISLRFSRLCCKVSMLLSRYCEEADVREGKIKEVSMMQSWHGGWVKTLCGAVPRTVEDKSPR